ncbi:mavicyanin-like [Olea europaea subsp. europaea]|uniref:Mavicyanin-like n=1 Tax=Olea europaea subsp. europaea TaxID=158383 RepID=A0A8S0QFA5_OLEEU|nr:mavicyanin-like [Olea europaea subsp. europaea]
MASFLGFYFVTLIILAITTFAPVTAAEELAVGGATGWRQPGANETEMYSNWAATRRFRIGDSLRFEYKNDSVVVVDKWGYYHCNESHPISVYNTGNTIINIEKPGPMYFESGDPEHCKNGQRLLVEVIRVHQDSPAPSPFSSAASSSVFSNLVFIYMVLITAASSIM